MIKTSYLYLFTYSLEFKSLAKMTNISRGNCAIYSKQLTVLGLNFKSVSDHSGIPGFSTCALKIELDAICDNVSFI